jgi:hypothetical protein
MYAARDAFQQTTTGTAAQSTTLLSACAVCFGIVFQGDTREGQNFLTVSGFTFAHLPILLESLWVEKMVASYKLYVSSCIHAAVVETALGISESPHLWCRIARECASRLGSFQRGKSPHAVSLQTGMLLSDEAKADVGQSLQDPVFTKGGDGARPAGNQEEIVAVWRAEPPNLLCSHLKLIRRAHICAAVAASVGACLLLPWPINLVPPLLTVLLIVHRSHGCNEPLPL